MNSESLTSLKRLIEDGYCIARGEPFTDFPPEKSTKYAVPIHNLNTGNKSCFLFDEEDTREFVLERFEYQKNNPMGYSVEYPSGLEVEYAYNLVGLPETVEVDNEPHVTATVYDHRGVVTDISYATNATTSFTYDVQQGYRLVAKETVKNGSTLEDIVYTYDDLGNILTIVDTGTIVPQSTVYTYDDLNRLISSDVTVASTTYSDDYAYDAIGRITSHNGTSYTYASNRHPHAPTSFGSSTLSYDLNGNISSSTISGQTTNYAYDALDRLATLTSVGTTTAAYFYGDGRDRIAKAADGYTTLYINPLVEYNREGYNDAVMVGGTRISTIDESATRWHVKDHLRSTAPSPSAMMTPCTKLSDTPLTVQNETVLAATVLHIRTLTK
jgi:YD repeat-containing protein